MSDSIISSAIDFISKLRDESDFSTIKFIKKDGSERIMKCTLNFKKIPNNKKPKEIDVIKILKLLNDNGIIHVFDIEKQEWRSVPYNKVEWLKDFNNNMYKIKR